LTVNVPSFQDLDSDADRVSTDTASAEFSGTASPNPFKIETSQEVAVRLSRNASWSSADLAAALAGSDPMMAIQDRVANYWRRRLQSIFIATWNGVIADNNAAPAGSEHVQGDLTNDISGVAFNDGVTKLHRRSGDQHDVDRGRLDGRLHRDVRPFGRDGADEAQQPDRLLPDSEGRVRFNTFLGMPVIVDDSMPRTGTVYDTWFFGPGAALLGISTPKVPTEVDRLPGAGNGGGQEVLYSRFEYAIHPVGHAYVGTSPNGGPSNAATTNNLADAGSWQRVYPERKQIKFARLVTREA
jgi:hypothetical protein